MNTAGEIRSGSNLRNAKPSNELDMEERTVSVFAPKKIVSDNDVSR